MTAYLKERDDLYQSPGQFEYDGMQLGTCFEANVLDQVKQFPLRSDDVLLAAYVKSGKTFIEELVWLVLNNADTATAKKSNVRRRVPTVEINPPGLPPTMELLHRTTRPRLMSTFMPSHFYQEQISNSNARIIVLLRNPKDVLASYYNYYKMCAMTGYFTGSWNQFFELFQTKSLLLGDWFDQVLGWWNYGKTRPNVMFVKYEDLKKKPHEEIQRIANFFGKNLTDEQVKKIAVHTSFAEMRQNPMTNMEDKKQYNCKISPFMRKGEVGDWKNYFTQAQSDFFDRKFEEKLAGSGLFFDFE